MTNKEKQIAKKIELVQRRDQKFGRKNALKFMHIVKTYHLNLKEQSAIIDSAIDSPNVFATHPEEGILVYSSYKGIDYLWRKYYAVHNKK